MDFAPRLPGERWLHGEFSFGGRPYRIMIVDDDIVMESGPSRFETYAYDDGPDSVVLYEFVTRLERLLDGGSWDGPPRAGSFWAYLKRRLFRSRPVVR